MTTSHADACPSCGGAGGGPFGRPGSAWDVEHWTCPRCKGTGLLLAPESSASSEGPGVAKGATPALSTPKRAAG